MFPVPYPLLSADHQAYIMRAHRLRGSAAAELIRHITRWLSAAAR